MSADLSLREGNLKEALAQLQEQVRKEPANAKHRIFLFQLLSVMGEWDRANTQLNVLADMDAATLAMVQVYREAVRCEALRADIFLGKRSPLIFGEPANWLALLAQAVTQTGSGHFAEAGKLREMAFEEAPGTRGSINGEAFEWIADADTRLGPILEAIVNGRYYWVPFNRISEIVIEKPTDLRDKVWMPAHFLMATGGEVVGLIPTRYPGSESSEDSMIRLARKTEWLEPSEGCCHGLGQRMLTTDAGDYPLMDIRSIKLESTEGGDSGAEPGSQPPER